jgi:hypothetical protein
LMIQLQFPYDFTAICRLFRHLCGIKTNGTNRF